MSSAAGPASKLASSVLLEPHRVDNLHLTRFGRVHQILAAKVRFVVCAADNPQPLTSALIPSR